MEGWITYYAVICMEYLERDGIDNNVEKYAPRVGSEHFRAAERIITSEKKSNISVQKDNETVKQKYAPIGNSLSSKIPICYVFNKILHLHQITKVSGGLTGSFK